MPMEIQTPEGRVKAMTPVILSASRSTDIPAYYGQWFMNRLRAGWCAWVNPFNRRPSYVSFRDVKAVVFWTKNPAPFLQHLDELDARGLHYYFQYTLNDYEREGFEPNVPALEKRIETFRRLSERIGPDRVVWRFDPIILSPGTGPRDILMRIWTIGKALRGRRGRLPKGPGEPRARHGSLHSRDRAVGRTRRGAEARDLRGPRQDPRTLAFGRLGH